MPEVEPLTKEENHLNMDISDLPLRGQRRGNREILMLTLEKS